MKSGHDTSQNSRKKETKGKNERTKKNDEKVKNETLKGRISSGRQRTEKNKKTTKVTLEISRERQIISVK